MTRTKDEYVKLKDRQGDGDVFISIHNDALDSSAPHGLTVYYHHDSQKNLQIRYKHQLIKIHTI